jgi:hypothetical protein
MYPDVRFFAITKISFNPAETGLENNLTTYKINTMLVMVKDVVSRIISKFLESQMLHAFSCKFFVPISGEY